MKYQKKRLFHRALSFILMLTLLMTDSSMLSLSASTVSGGNAVVTEAENEDANVTTVSGNDGADIPVETDAPAEAEPEDENEEEYIPEIITVSGNIPVREPEDFYEEPEAENYGALVSFDEKSRTYKTGERSYVTVIGTDASTYIDEDGNLCRVDNRLVENPVSTFGRVSTKLCK